MSNAWTKVIENELTGGGAGMEGRSPISERKEESENKKFGLGQVKIQPLKEKKEKF